MVVKSVANTTTVFNMYLMVGSCPQAIKYLTALSEPQAEA